MNEITRYQSIYSGFHKIDNKTESAGNEKKVQYPITEEDFQGMVPNEPIPMLDGFVYRGFLQEGGLGLLHRVFHPKQKKESALKVPKHVIWNDPVLLGTFEREVGEYRKISSNPFIVSPEDYRSVNGIPYLFLEYVAGTNLRGFLHKSTMMQSSGETPQLRGNKTNRYILISIARGLLHAHGCGVLHGDLKPENILIEEKTGGIKIIDFGGDVSKGIFTPAYASPEHYSPKDYDERSEVFCFGLIMYELLTNRLPASIIDLNVNGNEPTLQIDTDILENEISRCSEGEAEIMRFCLQGNQFDRPENFETLLRLLQTEYGDYEAGRGDPGETLKTRGIFLHAGRRYTEAAASFEECDRIRQGSDREFYWMWAYSLLRTGQIDEAARIAEAAAYPGMDEAAKKNVENIRSVCDWHGDRKSQAIEKLEKTVETSKDPVVIRNLAALYDNRGEYRRAMELYLQSTDLAAYDSRGFYETAPSGKRWNIWSRPLRQTPGISSITLR
jgi:serine/threonine protein kinase